MPDRPLRILLVTHESIRNGAPMVALQVMRWLRSERDDEIEVLALSDGPLIPDFAEIGPVHLVPLLDPDEVIVAWRDESEPDRSTIARFEAEELVRTEGLRPMASHLTGFDVLYLNSATSARALRILPEVPPVVISHIHELESSFNYWFPADDRELLFEHDPSFVVVSERVGRNLTENHGIERDRIVLSRNEFSQPDPPSPAAVRRVREQIGVTDDVVIGAMGSAEWRKGPDLFVQMAAVVARRLPDVALRFIWVGRTDEWFLRQYQTDVARLGLSDQFSFVGEQSEPAPWLGAMDVFCLTSREDPFPLVCLEAGSLGVPIVAFDNGGMTELAHEGGPDGPLIEIIDYLDVEAMANAVVARVTDGDLRRREGQRLQRWLEGNLFATGAVDRIADLIDERVDAARARPRSGDRP